MRWGALVPGSLIAVGGALLTLAGFQGGARLAIVVILPVIYGRSLEFVGGVLLLLAGLFTLPLAFASTETTLLSESDAAEDNDPSSSGGLILIGPIPIFFGAWKIVSARARTIVAIAGGLVLVAMAVVLVLFFG